MGYSPLLPVMERFGLGLSSSTELALTMGISSSVHDERWLAQRLRLYILPQPGHLVWHRRGVRVLMGRFDSQEDEAAGKPSAHHSTEPRRCDCGSERQRPSRAI